MLRLRPVVVPCLVAMCALAPGELACAPTTPSGDDGVITPRVRDVASFEAPADEGNLTGDEKTHDDQVKTMLTHAHGVRPRRYNGLLNGNVVAERCFVEIITQAAAFLNGRLAARGHTVRVDPVMLATNFISEGGFFPLNSNQTTGIDGFGALGIDTLVGNYAAVKPYMKDVVRRAVEKGDRSNTYTNEQGQQVRTLTDLDLEEGIYANAGLFAWSMAIAEGDMRRRGTNMSSLTPWVQFFWTTIYYNAGGGTGRRLLRQHGVSWAKTAWTHADDSVRYSQNAHYNALWRTASYRYMSATAQPSLAGYCAAKHGSACTCDHCVLQTACGDCVGTSGCGFCSDTYQCTASRGGCTQYLTDAAACASSPVTRPCTEAISCFDCFANPHCGWCDGNHTCMAGTATGAPDGCPSGWSFATCAADPCGAGTGSCTSCVAISGCGYCPTSGLCAPGSAMGPTSGSCPSWEGSAAACGGVVDAGPGVDAGPSGLDGGTPGCHGLAASCDLGVDSECCDQPGGPGICVAGACTFDNGCGRVTASCDPSAPNCCDPLACAPMDSTGATQCCARNTDACGGDGQCCGTMTCVSGHCVCRAVGESCVSTVDCCGTTVCDPTTGRCANP